jgi:hypothetical protein
MDYTVELDQAPGRDQTEERLTVAFADGTREEMRLHEYDRVYAVPGLYEEVVQHRLECRSPEVLVTSLVDQVTAAGEDPAGLRALDMGAGNGVVGEELRARGVAGTLVGMDAAMGAAPAAQRDRPALYAEYLTGDLSELPLADLVSRHGLNCLVGAGALGLGHISAESFDAAWRAFPPGAWLAVTAAEDVLDPSSGDVGAYVARLRAGEHDTDVLHVEPFRHRLRMSGEPITYVVIVARRRS